MARALRPAEQQVRRPGLHSEPGHAAGDDGQDHERSAGRGLCGDQSPHCLPGLRTGRRAGSGMNEAPPAGRPMVAAIDRELAARARGLRVTPEEQLGMLGARLYDAIGGAYTATRRTEPRIAAQIVDALGDARTVLNVGAGTGSYEPADREVTAVEPSEVMRRQRPAGSAPCVAAAAESLPFEDHSFDVAMAVSTVHHWGDPIAGLREMRRVARRVVVLTFDTDEPGWQDRFWLTRDYLPEFASVLAEFPSLAGMADAVGARAEPVPIPWDCTDGLFEAYWRRPGAYLEEHVRRAMSVWTRVGPDAEQRAVRSLRDDLDSGRWAERNSDLAHLETVDLGLRLLIA
ncbi:class I SAM-dependent methyltransferase [Streptomyces virginiae]|uniref:class I SAM-dependent methyltransferase n=1 Tax=Streptomyces virginiae TaxID=1961 RepID=UPI00368E58F8